MAAKTTRRGFLRTAGAAVGSLALPTWLSAQGKAKKGVAEPAAAVVNAKEAIVQKPLAAEIHLGVTCSDSRAFSSFINEAQNKVAAEYAKNGTRVEFLPINVPGAHIYPGLLAELESIVARKNAENRGLPTKFFVHIQTHGDVVPYGKHSETYSLHNLTFNENSPVNCGMIGGGKFAEEVEREILQASPPLTFDYRGEKREIRTEDDMLDINREAYGRRQMLAGLVENFNPARHARVMKGEFHDLISRQSPTLKRLLDKGRLEILAAVQNFRTGDCPRVDGRPLVLDHEGKPVLEGGKPIRNVTAMDKVFLAAKELREQAAKTGTAEQKDELKKIVAEQNPPYILFHSDIPQPRRTAMEALEELNRELGIKGPNPTGNTFASTVVSLNPTDPLAVVKSLGIIFATHYDRARTLVIMGRDFKEAQAILDRMKGDPYFQMTIDLLKRGKRSETNPNKWEREPIDLMQRTYLITPRSKPIKASSLQRTKKSSAVAIASKQYARRTGRTV